MSSAATTTNATTVAEIYAAFGRGDIPAILDRLAPEVAWEQWAGNDGQRAGLAHLQAKYGAAEVTEFFTLLGGWTVHGFEVLDIIGTGRQVAAELRVDFGLPSGGRLIDEEMHLWTFDDYGRVIRFRHYCDTAKHIRADAGEDTRG